MTHALFVQTFPEFSSVPNDARFATLLDFAEDDVNSNVWGDKTDRGIALLLGHMLATFDGTISTAGNVTSEKVGDLARSYAEYTGDDTELGQTKYGREFLRVRKTLLISPFVVC